MPLADGCGLKSILTILLEWGSSNRSDFEAKSLEKALLRKFSLRFSFR